MSDIPVQQEGPTVDPDSVIRNLSSQISDMSVRLAIQGAYIGQLEQQLAQQGVVIDALGQQAEEQKTSKEKVK